MYAPLPAVTISGQNYSYRPRWSGEPLLPADGYLAIDTETDLVDLKKRIPRLALAAASAGGQDNCLIHPDDLGSFLLRHKAMHFVCHNAAFDFWVVENHLRVCGQEEERRAWWAVAEGNRLHDSMLLDMLVRLATDDSFPQRRDLAVVAKQYAGLEITKDDPYRMRYGEMIGRDWADVEDAFFTYGVKDAIATRLAYVPMRKQALALAKDFGGSGTDILPDARQKFGPLSEAVQVKKAIALAQVTRNSMTVDLDWARQTEGRLRGELLRAVAEVQAICPIYKVTKDGNFALSGKTQAPAFDDVKLREHLARIKQEMDSEGGAPLAIASTSRGVSRAAKDWSDHAHRHPFLGHWIRAQELAKLLQFFAQFREGVDLNELAGVLAVDARELAGALRLTVNEEGPTTLKVNDLERTLTRSHRKLKDLAIEPNCVLDAARSIEAANLTPLRTINPSYGTMVRTGRTSCSAPNIQQIPRDSAFRQMFTASTGHLLLSIDYTFIELRTLAATALHRYGSSKMAEVIKAGVDPHAHTAAMMLGVPVDEFMAWKDNETVVEELASNGNKVPVKLKDRFDQARQGAKAVNFGVPGGLGVASLVGYARSTYKVDLTPEEAGKRREVLTKEVYPELDLYLGEDGPAIIARNLQADPREVRNELGDTHLSSISKILAGDPKRVDGTPYQPAFVSRIWDGLARLNRNPAFREALQKRQPGEDLAARVCRAGVATLTGRIRGRVGYSQQRNTPFQGLAADGAALALFRLIREGFRVVGFVHDEVLVELPDEGGYVSEARIREVEEILCREMERVLVGGIPARCEAALARRWDKKAKLIVEGGKAYPWQAVVAELSST